MSEGWKEGAPGAEREPQSAAPEATPSAPTATLPEVTNDQYDAAVDPEKLAAVYEAQRSLPPDAEVTLYHGLNASYGAALDVLSSEERGIEERRGPTLSLTPLAQFWKKGDVGLRYSIPRRLVAFPGEENPDAVVLLGENNVATIATKERTLPLTEYKGEVVRAAGTESSPELEERIRTLESGYEQIRSRAAYLREHVGTASRRRIEELLAKSYELYERAARDRVRDPLHSRGLPLGRFGIAKNTLKTLEPSGSHVEGSKEFGGEAKEAIEKIEEVVPKLHAIRADIVAEQSALLQEKHVALDALGAIDKRSGLMWKMGALNRSFIEGLSQETADRAPSLADTWKAAQSEKNPREFLKWSLTDRVHVLTAKLEHLDRQVELYDEELATYAELHEELERAVATTRQALAAVQAELAQIAEPAA